ncbi:hypothetical protein [Devosia psychrophila]|uniref:4-amino-4-deoxy-L-arabinose transferase n=1 Tax=Devosia psychrophila TaxID=728005 RepID=A0A0F5PRF8_9HYPH|nr:hypothetical protein [Devosia psychrophila]KKC30986.1 hypothetical protein WH91_21835 [Devosia psychrophila]SFC97485.1 4-amino-4-deoxy-L-arabinose transferase [Devosia psychrophila]
MDTVAQTQDAQGASLSSWRQYWPELVAALVWLVAFALLNGMPVWHDVTWQLWVARHLNAGVPLYDYIMETNPPLWFWMAQPLDLLSAATGLQPEQVLVSAIFLLIGISLALSAALASRWSQRERALTYAGILVATILICIGDFAQREPLVLIGTIPYALIIARRVEGEVTPWPLTLAIALLATPLLALKHYFVLIPILLEAWLIWERRRKWRPLRIETVVLIAGALGYALAILVFTPHYLTRMVPALSIAFGGLRAPLRAILINQMNLMLITSAFYFWHFRRELRPQAKAMLLLASAFALSYYMQFRGWGYHASPVVACLLLAILMHLAFRPAIPRLRWSEYLFATLMIVLATLPQVLGGPYRNDFTAAAERLLQRTQPGQNFAMLTTRAVRPWPAVEDKRLNWSLRYFQYWMLPSVANLEAAGIPIDSEFEAYLSTVRLETVQDFKCNPPDTLIIDYEGIEPTVGFDQARFDILGFFEKEPQFAALMESYELIEQLGPFAIYEPASELPPPTGTCHTLVPRRD